MLSICRWLPTLNLHLSPYSSLSSRLTYSITTRIPIWHHKLNTAKTEVLIPALGNLLLPNLSVLGIWEHHLPSCSSHTLSSFPWLLSFFHLISVNTVYHLYHQSISWICLSVSTTITLVQAIPSLSQLQKLPIDLLAPAFGLLKAIFHTVVRMNF